MNETIELLKNHRTYRDFDPNYQLSDEELQEILIATRQAPSWMNGQMYSIIVIKDQKNRQKLVDWNPGNPHILTSSVFLLFVADLKRTQVVAEHYHKEYLVAEGLDSLITATTDTALALQNAVIAVEALGLGSVVVGSIRKNIEEISQLFALPDYVVPIAGLSIGKPTVSMQVKPRLPEKTVVHQEKFQAYNYQELVDYDQIMEVFGEARETKKWT